METLLPLQPRDYLILFALAGGPLHGHGILKAVEEESGGVTLDPANLYRSLKRLERDTLIARSGGQGGGRRQNFELTDVGGEALKAEAQRLVLLADAARARSLVDPKVPA
ncbi:MAG: PadR family transcriptional regulator [Acidobacteria bacterium]|nr:PadR family transcriptional regulator [Acidobacteriota bacterium]